MSSFASWDCGINLMGVYTYTFLPVIAWWFIHFMMKHPLLLHMDLCTWFLTTGLIRRFTSVCSGWRLHQCSPVVLLHCHCASSRLSTLKELQDYSAMVAIFSLSVHTYIGQKRFWLSQSVWINISLFVRVIFAYFPHFLWWTRQKLLFHIFSVKYQHIVYLLCAPQPHPVHVLQCIPHITNLLEE